MIESLYIVDSSGICLYSAPLSSAKQVGSDMICGFIVAQNQYFQEAFGESTKKFTLEKKEILIQTVDLKSRNVLLALSYNLGDKREESFAKTILDGLSRSLKGKEQIFKNLPGISTKELDEELSKILEKTLKNILCLYLVKGFLGITNHCRKTDTPITDDRPCDFNYAVFHCDRYNLKT
ncbi:MAG: hypothetical protein WED05_12050 [Candidatus Atabeyarchaeum deiterrae]